MITALFELFAFGGILFWVALATAISILTFLTDRNWHFTKLILIGAIVALLWPNFKTLTGTQLTVITISYFLIGIVYSFIRWYRNVNNVIEKYTGVLKKYKVTDLTNIDETYEKVQTLITKLDRSDRHQRDEAVYAEAKNDYSQLNNVKFDIDPNENKTMLYNWVFYWPWSIIKFLTADLAESLYDMCKNQYKNIVNHLLRKNLA